MYLERCDSRHTGSISCGSENAFSVYTEMPAPDGSVSFSGFIKEGYKNSLLMLNLKTLA